MARLPTDYRHAYPLFALIGVGLVVALVLRASLVPEGFGVLGPFRSDAPLVVRAAAIRHRGVDSCAACHDHEKQVRLHAKDAHASVPCETCHGPAGDHIADPTARPVVVPRGKEPCLQCHGALAARPGWFPQVEWREHYRFVGVADEGLACTACHDPHEPLFMDRDLRTARLHPLIQRCRDCHAGRADETLPRPDHHPAIFECRYCHAPVVADYETRPHKVVRCTTCHIFFRASAFAGRILRDADPRFCLLCHGEAEFRSNTSAPGISWPDGHLDDVADDEADRTKRCIDCHRDRIHLLSHELVRPPAAPPNGGEEGADDEE